MEQLRRDLLVKQEDMKLQTLQADGQTSTLLITQTPLPAASLTTPQVHTGNCVKDFFKDKALSLLNILRISSPKTKNMFFQTHLTYFLLENTKVMKAWAVKCQNCNKKHPESVHIEI